MNMNERIKLLKAMEFIVRNANDGGVIYNWLSSGIADGDIGYGDLSAGAEDAEDLEHYLDDADFADIMDTFLSCMSQARKSGGLYCDGVASRGEGE